MYLLYVKEDFAIVWLELILKLRNIWKLRIKHNEGLTNNFKTTIDHMSMLKYFSSNFVIFYLKNCLLFKNMFDI